mgnify:CR=1 FL=1
MKRSEINATIKQFEALLDQYRFRIPPYLSFTPEEWADKNHEWDEIRDNMLGWDITDYGKGDFDKFASLVAEPRSERTCAVCFDGEEDKLSIRAYPYGHADSPEEQARELFDVLRHVDDEKMELAFVRFPSLDGVGMAVYNRLLRAAGFEVIEL